MSGLFADVAQQVHMTLCVGHDCKNIDAEHQCNQTDSSAAGWKVFTSNTNLRRDSSQAEGKMMMIVKSQAAKHMTQKKQKNKTNNKCL